VRCFFFLLSFAVYRSRRVKTSRFLLHEAALTAALIPSLYPSLCRPATPHSKRGKAQGGLPALCLEGSPLLCFNLCYALLFVCLSCNSGFFFCACEIWPFLSFLIVFFVSLLTCGFCIVVCAAANFFSVPLSTALLFFPSFARVRCRWPRFRV
jgi:hypothetical protein